jgi:stress-induced morphogen
MPIEQTRLERMIRDGIPGADVRIEDLRGDGDHYTAHVTSPAFRGLSRVQQHQLVYAALKGIVGKELHALSVHTALPETVGNTNR